jgi:hypothetical protein
LHLGIWAVAYRFLGALPDNRYAMLYSLNAMTTYGHANLDLKDHWQLMGSLEALNGMLLFGLTTAFLFAMIQKIWRLGSRTASCALATRFKASAPSRAGVKNCAANLR